MQTRVRISVLLLTVVLMVSLSFSFSRKANESALSQGLVRHIETVILDKEKLVREVFAKIQTDGKAGFEPLRWLTDKKLQNEDIVLLVYSHDSLIFWNNNSVPLHQLSPITISYGLRKIGNGWYIAYKDIGTDLQCVALVLVKREFTYENRLLRNAYQRQFNIPSGIEFNTSANGFVVRGSDGSGLFYVYEKKNRTFREPCADDYWSMSFYFVAILVYLLLYRYIAKAVEVSVRTKALVSIFMPLVLLLLLALSIRYHEPWAVFRTPLFNPAYYALNDYLSSVGSVLLLSFVLFFLVYVIDKMLEPSIGPLSGFLRRIGFSGAILVLYFFLLLLIMRSFVINSVISFQAYNLFEKNAFVFVFLAVLLINYIGLTVLFKNYCRFVNSMYHKVYGDIWLVFLIALLSGILWLAGMQIPLLTWVFFFSTYALFRMFRMSDLAELKFSRLLMLVFIFSGLTIYFTNHYVHEKETARREVLAVNLSEEHDPIAEMLLPDIDYQIRTDTVLQSIFNQPHDYYRVYNYIKKRYFSGYWNKYDLQLTLCLPQDSVYVKPPESKWYPCYSFFKSLLEEYGLGMPDSRFYYLNTGTGRIGYFGRFVFKSAMLQSEVAVFLELDSRLTSDELGYPELLIEEKRSRNSTIGSYGYAKYNLEGLVARTGSFSYPARLSGFGAISEGEFSGIRFDGFDHLFYRYSANGVLVLSHPAQTVYSLVVNFSYIFIFFFTVVSLLMFALSIPRIRQGYFSHITSKIHISFSVLVVISLLSLTSVTIYLVIDQFKEKNFELLREKLQSVYIEIDHKLAFQSDLANGWNGGGYDNLDQLLVKFSNVFYTDINLFDPQGMLLATSRPEIFDKQLLGRKIDYRAWFHLTQRYKTEYLQEESIGNLRYLSAYLPFYNADGKLLAYLNLPYFTRQDEFRKDLINVTIGIINIFVLFILLAIITSITLSNQITKPLALIQQKLRNMRLEGGSNYIIYDGKDEIGRLVKEYNQKVDELAHSARILAQNEREMAWREMARQVAHEIKNPLTPMRLSIQHMVRLLNENASDMPNQVAKLSKVLIEQIDNLSSIASAFSGFASLPAARDEAVDLVEVIQKLVTLFESNRAIFIRFNRPGIDKALVLADNEQLNRALLNIVTNAVQSVPVARKAQVSVILTRAESSYRVEVQDNGLGIPEELQERLFQPNFTTKSSGTGLGLAITRNIIRQYKGEVSFRTVPGKGTSFFVELPAME